jgi:hypothetical protein
MMMLASVYFSITTDDTLIWIFITALLAILFWLAFMIRQHYALTLQDRIVRLELRYRYFTLTGKRFEDIEGRLRDSQIFALRFCPDEELPAMTERVLNENLSGTKIKQGIINWKGDYERV